MLTLKVKVLLYKLCELQNFQCGYIIYFPAAYVNVYTFFTSLVLLAIFF